MKAFVISIPGHEDSQLHADKCIQSVEDTKHLETRYASCLIYVKKNSIV